MSNGKPSMRVLLNQARANGHDAFGIANSPETLRTLAEVSRERFLHAAQEREELQRWVGFTADVARVPSLPAGEWQWVIAQIGVLRSLPAAYAVHPSLAELERVVCDVWPESKKELAQLGELPRQIERLLSESPTPGILLVLRVVLDLLQFRAAQEAPATPSKPALREA